MSADDSSNDAGENGSDDPGTDEPTADESSSKEPEIEELESHEESTGTDVRERLEAEADRAIEQFDEGIVDLLSWILETETRARIYVHLRQHPDSTSDEIAGGTGLYPSTVREALAELHDEGTVTRGKRQNDGAGNNPYEYSAIPPSDLVGEMVEEVQTQLNTLFNLDEYINAGDGSDSDDVVTITVTDEDSSEDGDDA